ncbi:MAG: VCBS repeat-containing protein [Bdellovibrionales bacterium]|nr:VCBS repeat-containing protein [Bdellovibrionales bacterium]
MIRGINSLRRIIVAPLLLGAATFAASPAAAVDFDGDGSEDIAVYRPSFGEHYFIASGEGPLGFGFQWGLNGDTPVSGNFSTATHADIAVWRPAAPTATGVWYIRYDSANNYLYSSANSFAWGLPSDIPQACKRDAADMFNDLIVWRPSNGTWYTRLSGGSGSDVGGAYSTSEQQQWGLSNDTPVAADYDNDGRCDYAIFRESASTGQATWYIVLSGSGSGSDTAATIPFGLNGDIPVPGDYDGDGQIDLAVWRPSSGHWLIRPSSVSQGSLENWIRVYQWGLSGDAPVPMDYDGDGITDLVVYRENDVTSPGFPVWYIRKSPSNFGSAEAQQWGLTNDVAYGDRPGSTN